MFLFMVQNKVIRFVWPVVTARYTIVQSAVLRLHVLHVVRPSGRLSVRLEILKTNCTDNAFALRSPKPTHLLPGNMGKFWGD